MTDDVKARYIERARDLYQTDDCEIDDDAVLSEVDAGNKGAWVQAWVWVNAEELKDDPS